MHLILTHEQADFDGVAACLAAHFLNPDAYPVLSRRLNRNVRAFLTLYGEELPFVQFDDLPREQVDEVTLLDTQSMPSIKGASDATRVHVVDHHPAGGQLPGEWTATLEEVGATTTILVEELSERGVELDVIALTAMLLGIYEDTGSLTYASTTSRDLVAAAWLLERGANLTIAADFLHHPLSLEQRDLYEVLLEQAETHEVHGLSVVIASAQRGEMIDEISTLAHKLRDVYDPAGLFVLVEMDSHVQLVARSTDDAIDVSRVAERFGGGGHPRAAAALIRDSSVKHARKALLSMLPEVIEPPITVAQIMSRGPQVFPPDAKVSDAAQRMQRFGHEGYPVVSDGRVVGLLTRREVDRAMTHGLGGKTVASVMSAGEVTVEPDDSVQHLQKLMIQHDWGQVPVIDPHDSSVIGIVTRTDLIKTLASPQESRDRENIAARLKNALPAPRYELLRAIARAADERGDALYIVGGFVRDLLLGNPSHDFDLVVEGDAIDLAAELARRFGGRVSTHRRFGTAKWSMDRTSEALRRAITGQRESHGPLVNLPDTLDLVTARSEFYPHPTALPSIQSGSIKLDLHRRDFTINTLAVRLDGGHFGQILDHWGGGRDLEDGLIRVLHSLSFVDDPTRMLRAVRLEQRLGFEIESRTLTLLLDAIPLLEGVSGDRIRSELALMLPEPEHGAMMRRGQELGLLSAIHPALGWNADLNERWDTVRSMVIPDEWAWDDQGAFDHEFCFFGLWLSSVGRDHVREAAGRLAVPGTRTVDIQQAIGLRKAWELDPPQTPSAIVSRFDQLSLRSLALVWIDPASPSGLSTAIDNFMREWRHVRPMADGNTLKKRGLPPGPVYREILSSLRNAWLDGKVKTPEQEQALLSDLIEGAQGE